MRIWLYLINDMKPPWEGVDVTVVASAIMSQRTDGDLMEFSRDEMLRDSLSLPASTSQL